MKRTGGTKRNALLGVVESAYAAAASREEWAFAVTDALATFYPHHTPPFILWSVAQTEGVHDIRHIAGRGASPAMLATVRAMQAAASPDMVRRLWRDHSGVGTVSESLSARERQDSWTQMMSHGHHANDSIGLYFNGAHGHVVTVNIPLAKPRILDRSERGRLLRLVAHFSLSERLLSKKVAPPRAVLGPDGGILHAEEDATSRGARASLRAQVLRIERARVTRDQDDALDLWRGMADGRWSVVDEFDTDGKRFFVARENLRAAAAPRALTEREKQMLALLAEGKNNKLIGYELGLSPSRVSTGVRAIQESSVRSIARSSSSGPRLSGSAAPRRSVRSPGPNASPRVFSSREPPGRRPRSVRP